MIGREQLQGKQLVVRDGQEIGAIERVFVNDATGEPDWATVRTGILRREHVVPLAGAQMSGDTIRIPYLETAVKNSPKLESGDHLGPEQIAALSKHYGTEAAASRSAMGTAGPATRGSAPMSAAGSGGMSGSAPMSGAASGAASGSMTRGPQQAAGTPIGSETQGRAAAPTGTGRARSADEIKVPQDLHREATLDAVRYGERIHVAKENREAGRVRLRKYVEQTPIEERVQLQHETYELVRVPVDDLPQGSDKSVDWTEQVQELVLFDEQAHITKEVVPLERVMIRKKVVSEEKVFRDQVRTEQFEVIQPDGSQAKAEAMTAEARTAAAERRRR